MRLKLFLSLLLSAVLSTMAQTAVVTGSVVDADTGSPIPGAVVTIPDQGISVTMTKQICVSGFVDSLKPLVTHFGV